jgi:predicted nucleic acid-binding protein
MIAAQTVAAGATLVTRDKAFSHVHGGLTVEKWT